ncbi:MAG: hydrolase [Acidobacteria bacterium]|nr:MAG: hydrolase [Acidobacteriota bacterium]
MYRAVIFDVDGTLVDSNDAHAWAWIQALAEGGRHVDFARVRPLIGKGGDKLLPELAGIRRIFQREFIPRINATRGAQQLLEWMRDERLTLVVASSAETSEVRDLLRIAGAVRFFDATTSSDEADRSKPDPDIVHAALERTGCRASEAIMIGDTPYDIEAADRAGIGTIALRCGGWWSDGDLSRAVAIYADPADLLNHYDVSPFKRPLPARSA